MLGYGPECVVANGLADLIQNQTATQYYYYIHNINNMISNSNLYISIQIIIQIMYYCKYNVLLHYWYPYAVDACTCTWDSRVRYKLTKYCNETKSGYSTYMHVYTCVGTSV